ncbi:ChaN family lipoprotein [Salinarimonas sp.]|uniref:ChaN family lipoprotein n=1 Tax=Salinarimonas sp. TaxID=2766526 RepID=UPI00391B9E7A
MRSLFPAALLLAALALPAAASAPPEPVLPAAHPLSGTILDARTGAAIEPAEVAARIGAADLVLLGERHGNPDHHALQAWATGIAAAAAPEGRVVLEMVARADDAPLVRARAPEDVAGLGEALAWEARGWPEFALYAPILDAALGAGWRLSGGDVSREPLMAVARDGLAALDSEMRAALSLDAPLAAQEQARLSRAIALGHCDLLPAERIPPMADAQRLRDATLADALLAEDGPAVLIAGALNVDRGMGVPAYLARRAPERSVLAIAFVEIGADGPLPEESVAGFGSPQAAFDIVWLTGAPAREDPCLALAERFGRSGASSREP